MKWSSRRFLHSWFADFRMRNITLLVDLHGSIIGIGIRSLSGVHGGYPLDFMNRLNLEVLLVDPPRSLGLTTVFDHYLY